MKSRKYLPVLLFFFVVLLAGCATSTKAEVKKAVSEELDLLKNLDPDTTQKYISYEDLFSDASQSSSISPEIEEVFSLFFKNFNYKIMEVNVDKDSKEADASVRLTTIDAKSLAHDFASAHLREEILKNASTGTDSNASAQEHYLLLGKLLKKGDYEKVESNCTIHLVCQDDSWVILKDATLENDLVGGLLTYLSDPGILSPSETVSVYMKTLKDMDAEQMNTFLNLDSVLNSEDETEKSIATALVEQVHKCFNYKVTNETDLGYTAQVTLSITSFDSDAILSAYQKQLDQYLATAEAVMEGSEGRLAKSQEFLLDAINSNEDTATSEVTLNLTNDGVDWNVELGSEIGKALFGNLSTDTASTVNEDSGYTEDEEYCEDEDYGEEYSEDEDEEDYDEEYYDEGDYYGEEY